MTSGTRKIAAVSMVSTLRPSRRHPLALVACALVLLGQAMVLAQQPAPSTQPAPQAAPTTAPTPRHVRPTQPPTVLRIYTLNHANPAVAMSILSDLFRNRPDYSFVSSATTKSIIVRMPQDESVSDTIEKVLSAIDKPAPPSAPGELDQVKVFKMRVPIPSSVLERVIDPHNTAIDYDSKTLVVKGTWASIEAVQEFIKTWESLNPPQPSAPSIPECRVRLAWLMAAPEVAQLAPVPPDLGEALESLEKLGLKDLGMVTQVLVKASPEFELTATPRAGSDYDLEVRGKILDRTSDGYRVSIEIEITQLRNQTTRRVLELNTTITAPVDHPIVFGMTPIDGKSSLLVLELASGR